MPKRVKGTQSKRIARGTVATKRLWKSRDPKDSVGKCNTVGRDVVRVKERERVIMRRKKRAPETPKDNQ